MTVDLYRHWIRSHVVCYLENEVFRAVVNGLDKATRIHKNSWTRTTDNRVFTKILYGIMKFTEIVVFPTKRVLHLDQVPQILRNKLYSHVQEMPLLVSLNLGSGSGGTVTDAFEDKFIEGIAALTCLRQLTLRYDATDRIIEVKVIYGSFTFKFSKNAFMQAASQTCYKTLTLLDVERSRKVTDDSVNYLLKFIKLKSLGIFHTSITNVGKAEVIFGLQNLEELPRGDFMCDALEDVNESKPNIISRKVLINI